jgi:hypothetical protein
MKRIEILRTLELNDERAVLIEVVEPRTGDIYGCVRYADIEPLTDEEHEQTDPSPKEEVWLRLDEVEASIFALGKVREVLLEKANGKKVGVKG